MHHFSKKNLFPLILTVICILADQLTKYFVTVCIPRNTIGVSFFGDCLRFIHVNNTGIAFSMGDGWPVPVRFCVFAILPLAVILLMLWYAISSRELSMGQRWLIAGIGGGGIGNLVDRFFRPQGVVDFIDVKFYGIFGLERWPTFNVADSCVMICGILLVVSIFKSSFCQVKSGENGEINE